MKKLALILPLLALALCGCIDQNKAAALAQKKQDGLVARKN